MRTKRVRRFPEIGTYVVSEKILGTKFGFDAVFRLIPSIGKLSGIVSMAKTVWVLETWGGANTELQREIAGFFFPDKIAQINRILSDGVSTIFLQPQVLTLIKLLILYGEDRQGELNMRAGDIGKIRLALLGINDGIDQQYRYVRNQIDDEDLIRQVTLEIASASFFVSNPRIGLSLTRATQLYINIHRQIAASETRNYVNIEAVFESATGFKLTEFLSLGIGLLVHFLRNWKVGEYPKDPGFIYFEPKVVFANSHVKLERIEEIVHHVSGSLDFFSAELNAQSKRELLYDFIAFRTRPLVQIREGLYLPISVQFLLDRMTMGVYWIIFDYLKTSDKDAHLRFMNYHGEIFQNYVEELLRAILKRDAVEAIVVDEEYRVGKDIYRTPDLVIVGNDYVILVEASATRMQAKRTIALGDSSAFEEDFQKMVMHNARSLNTYIGNLNKGHGLAGYDVTGKPIYPVIITLESIIPHPIMNIYVDKILKENNLLVNEMVKPLSILAIDELEELEGYSEMGLLEALKNWLSLGMARASLSSLIREQNPGRGLNSDWLKTIQTQIFNEATQMFFGKKLNGME